MKGPLMDTGRLVGHKGFGFLGVLIENSEASGNLLFPWYTLIPPPTPCSSSWCHPAPPMHCCTAAACPKIASGSNNPASWHSMGEHLLVPVTLWVLVECWEHDGEDFGCVITDEAHDVFVVPIVQRSLRHLQRERNHPQRGSCQEHLSAQGSHHPAKEPTGFLIAQGWPSSTSWACEAIHPSFALASARHFSLFWENLMFLNRQAYSQCTDDSSTLYTTLKDSNVIYCTSQFRLAPSLLHFLRLSSVKFHSSLVFSQQSPSGLWSMLQSPVPQFNALI